MSDIAGSTDQSFNSPKPTKDAVFVGIHLAQNRVNVSVVTEHGELLGESSSVYSPAIASSPNGYIETHPEIWWSATRIALGQMMSKARSLVVSPSQLKAVSVCGQPGILLTMDRAGKSLMPAILAEDSRAADVLTGLNYQGQEHCRRRGFPFRSTDAIAKICWIKENFPETYENAIFMHHIDYIIGMLKGEPDVTEYSIAADTGCDLIDEVWPDWLDYDMHLSVRERLPRLVALGSPIGKVSAKASAATGLPAGMSVVMGTASATAAFLAAGTKRPGDFYTEIDDQLHIRGMSRRMISYPNCMVRMFKLPNHIWFFSTESQTGSEWMNVWFDKSMIDAISVEAVKNLPTQYLAYPNVRKNETFPFCSTSAEGFITPATDNRVSQFASCLQGTAFFERLCYDSLKKLADVDASGDIYSGGACCKFDEWMQCRADVTGRVNRRMVSASNAAFGAAMMAAIGAYFNGIEPAVSEMIREDKVFFPNSQLSSTYEDLYGSFISLIESQGFI
ncbi:MAG: hypothetical protein LBU65_10210 [Planctomycetaceae bacterium]|nr:hypothetical protein [Planctomycetaceae bacterium]